MSITCRWLGPECIKKLLWKQLDDIISFFVYFNQSLSNIIILSFVNSRKLYNKTLLQKINYCTNNSSEKLQYYILYYFKMGTKNKPRENSYRVSSYWKVSSPELIALINERISWSGALRFPFPASFAFSSLALALRLWPYMKRWAIPSNVGGALRLWRTVTHVTPTFIL